MGEVRDPKREPGKKQFIKEKVVRQPLTRKQMIRRGILLLFAAVLFGGAAGVGFAVSQPWAARHFGDTSPTEPMISIPKDELTESESETEVNVDLSSQEETQAVQEPPESEAVEKVVRNAIDNYRYTVEDLSELFTSLRQQVQGASKGIVVVHSVQQQVDWFDNPVETTGLYAGAIIAQTPQELLILTPEAAVERADSIAVTFADGAEVGGRMKQQDTLTGMAVVSVNVSDIEENTLKVTEALPLGNSYLVREGDLIVALGSPAGIVHSVDYGFVSYIMKNAQMVDQVTRLFYSRISAEAKQGTFFMNTSGELIGWAQEAEEEDDQMTVVMGISDYKGILENLTNGLGAPCFGIEGQEVSEGIAAQGLPQGIYVLNSVTGRPAYEAGIQNGDIITKIDDHELSTMKDFQNTIDNLECGQLIHVTVQRNGREEYTELEFQVTVGAR